MWCPVFSSVHFKGSGIQAADYINIHSPGSASVTGMYDLKFQMTHHQFKKWRQKHSWSTSSQLCRAYNLYHVSVLSFVVWCLFKHNLIVSYRQQCKLNVNRCVSKTALLNTIFLIHKWSLKLTEGDKCLAIKYMQFDMFCFGGVLWYCTTQEPKILVLFLICMSAGILSRHNLCTL